MQSLIMSSAIRVNYNNTHDIEVIKINLINFNNQGILIIKSNRGRVRVYNELVLEMQW